MIVIRVLLSGFGTGLLPLAPGTWGSTPGVVFALVLVWALGPHWSVDVALALIAVFFSLVCLRYGGFAEEHWQKKDPGPVVADEIAGQSITLLGLPWLAMTDTAAVGRNLALGVIGFFAFRLFDILKPPPARGLQRLPAGAGILVDDLFAGAYALVLTQLVVRVVIGWS